MLVCLSVQVSGVITDSAGIVRYVLSGTWDSKLEGANVLNGDDANLGKVEYITGQSKLLWQRRYPPYVTYYLLSLMLLTLYSVNTSHC